MVDVVAGGDGYSGKRGRGIDPASGRNRRCDVVADGPSRGKATGNIIAWRGCRWSTACASPTGAETWYKWIPSATSSADFKAPQTPPGSPFGRVASFPSRLCRRCSPDERKNGRCGLCLVRPRTGAPARQQRDHLQPGGDSAGQARFQPAAIPRHRRKYRTSRVRQFRRRSGCWSMVNRGFSAGRSTTRAARSVFWFRLATRTFSDLGSDRAATMASSYRLDPVWRSSVGVVGGRDERTKRHGRPLRYNEK